MTQASQDVKDVVWDHPKPSPPPKRSKSRPVSPTYSKYETLSALESIFPPSNASSEPTENKKSSFLAKFLGGDDMERSKRKWSTDASPDRSPTHSPQPSPKKASSTHKSPRNNIPPTRPRTRSASKSMASTPPKSPNATNYQPESSPHNPELSKLKRAASLRTSTKTPTETPTRISKRPENPSPVLADEVDLTTNVTVHDTSSTPRVKGLMSLALQKTPKKPKLTQPTPITQVSQPTYQPTVKSNKNSTSTKQYDRPIPPSPPSPKHKPIPQMQTTPISNKPSTPVTPSQSRSSEVVIAKTDMIKKQFERFMVMEVSFGRFAGDAHVWGTRNVSKPNDERIMVLRLFNEIALIENFVTLEGDWCDTPAKPGHIVHILATFDPKTRHAIINDLVGVIILHPDLLISGTSVSSSFTCMRKAVLNERIKDGGTTHPKAVYGSLVHSLLQKALTSGQFSPDTLEAGIEATLKNKAVDLASVGETDKSARDNLLSYIPSVSPILSLTNTLIHFKIAAWGNAFVTDKLSNKNCVEIGRDTASVCITKVLEVEESVWSPMYGLKGKIDATVEMKTTHAPWNANAINKLGGTRADSPDGNPTLTVPMEIKTGTGYDHAGHKAQLLLYSLMLSDRYAKEVKSGLLLYLRSADTDPKLVRTSSDTALRPDMRASTDKVPVRAASDLPLRTYSNQGPIGNGSNDGGFYGTMKGVETRRHEIRGILIARNIMANYLYEYSMNPEQSELPSVIRNPFTCSHCFTAEACMIYHKAYENGTATTSGVEDLFSKHTMHISTDHLQFFKTWDQCISWEASLSLNLQKDIWAFSSKQRESQGKCFANMVMLEEHPSARGYEYIFGKIVDGKVSASPGFINLLDQHINVGDYVCVSTEEGEFGLGSGTVKKLSLESVVVSCTDKISQPLATKRGDTVRIFTKDSNLPSVLWRLDRNEVGSGFSTARSNLLKLFSSNDALTVKRRRLIVDLETPVFENLHQSQSPAPPTTATTTTSGTARNRWATHADFTQLNPDQRKAIHTVLSANDYALILGMPGTGKTTTIALMVKAVAMEGKSILITSYTHSAVDNLLLKLAELKIDFLRLSGSAEQVHPELRRCTLDYKSFSSIAQLEAFLKTKNIVATTCLGINSPLLTHRKFDYCIVDEASQITLPVCLGPLRFASVFVLVGDHYQLPPLVRSPEARVKGLDQSLFKRLGEAHPEAVASLLYQYRMNSDIMMVSNTLIYSHKLRCGTAGVAESILSLNTIPGSMPSWIDHVVLPSRKVVFLNTDLVPALEKLFGETIKNKIEAVLVAQIADALLQYGLSPSDLGIISPYRIQLKIIRQLLGEYASQSSLTNTQLSPGGLSQSYPHSKIEVHTVDKFQGRDKDCIIVSLVRANDAKMVGELLTDWRRVNVAFTRAKKKLVVIGSLSTLQSNHLFKMFLELLETNKWISMRKLSLMHLVDPKDIYNLPLGAHKMYKRPETPSKSASATKREKKTFGAKHGPLLKNILADVAC